MEETLQELILDKLMELGTVSEEETALKLSNMLFNRISEFRKNIEMEIFKHPHCTDNSISDVVYNVKF